MFLIAGNRTQVLDLVQLIDVTVNELIVLIRRVFVDRHHILTSQTVHSFPTLSTYKLIYVNLESERTLKFFSASKAQTSLSKPLCKAFMEIITVATRRSEGRRARCITRTTTWPTSSSPRTWSRLRSSTGPCSTSAGRSSFAATGGEEGYQQSLYHYCPQGPPSTRIIARASLLWTLTRLNGMTMDP